MKLCIFDKYQIALDLGINVGFKKKAELRKNIIDNGGIVSYIVTRKCSFVVASDPEKCDVSSKCRMAVKYHLPVVSMDYIWDSVQAGEKLSIDQYTVAGKSKSLDFRSGKISAATREKAVVSVRRFAPKPSFNIRCVRVWQAGEAEAPLFDEENYEVAKYAVFQGLKKKQEQSTFYTLEIQVAISRSRDENDNEHGPRFRLFSHHGAILDAVAGKPCTQEMRYFTAADQALSGYLALYREQVSTHRMHVVEGTFSRNVGSRKLQQILAVLESEMGVASAGVQTVVEHIWREAVGEVETILCTPVSSIKLDQVEKAEALLMKLRDVGNVESDAKPILKEFYDTLPHNEETSDSVKLSRSWLSQKQDLCQLIRDMVSVSEATSWSTRTGVQAKYRALRCNVTHVEPESEEYKLISEDILASVEGNVKINVKNIFAVQRPIEDSAFRHDLDDKRSLFHSSRVENFLGILSRGLLMPKIVVNDFGGTRSDAGMLGSGIYFASAASKSAMYSTPSKACGTRLMVVGEVALGRCCDFTTIDTTLRKPPEGYDSVHGVGRKHDNSSAFQDDEYVIYSVNQQRLRYLVEFTINEELPTCHLSIDDVGMEIDTSLPAQLAEIDLCDVQGVADPLSRVQSGLVASSADGQVELKAVHVRARLVDLAAQVVVLQQYHNSSSSAIEAKYVFPLGDGAAVCGFEAFINDKHIVGEVKEKETAHREYKQAISEGHGAYLMDQDEETPDVFTVSVGNLPPNATVLIKITYVAELQVEAELISFRLPGSVAPWKHDSATRVKTQDKTDTYKLTGGETSVQVAVEMPFDIRSLDCPTHSVKSKRTASKAVVELRAGQDITDGFQLLVGLAEIHVPRMWVERHPDRPDHQACMLTFYPEFEVGSEVKTELVLLLDVSNSMKGTPLQSAKKVALLILRALDPAWTFNVVFFGTRYSELFPSSQAISEESMAKAEKFIQTAQADMGNTEVFRPLHAYFLLPPAEGATRNVLLVSDGHLNNETSVMADAHDNYHHTRIFTFGVSPTCNIYTLKSLARVSAGSFDFFDTKVKSKWEEKVKGQLNKACQPGLTSVAVEWRQYDDNLPRPVQAPERITALFNGTRQVIYGFVPNCTMAFLSAVVGGQEVSTVVSTSELGITTGLVVHRLTARGVIQDWEAGLLSDDRTHHEVVKMNSKQDIIELSKEYSIVTQFTSFVAIEKRDKDEDMTTKKGPTITDLVSRETVDILDYMSWQGLPEKMDVDQAQKEGEPSSFGLVLKTLTGKTMSLSGEGGLKVEDLMQQIQEKEGIPPDQQRLIWNGTELATGKSLAAYDIHEGSVLHLVTRLRGGHELTEELGGGGIIETDSCLEGQQLQTDSMSLVDSDKEESEELEYGGFISPLDGALQVEDITKERALWSPHVARDARRSAPGAGIELLQDEDMAEDDDDYGALGFGLFDSVESPTLMRSLPVRAASLRGMPEAMNMRMTMAAAITPQEVDMDELNQIYCGSATSRSVAVKAASFKRKPIAKRMQKSACLAAEITPQAMLKPEIIMPASDIVFMPAELELDDEEVRQMIKLSENFGCEESDGVTIVEEAVGHFTPYSEGLGQVSPALLDREKSADKLLEKELEVVPATAVERDSRRRMSRLRSRQKNRVTPENAQEYETVGAYLGREMKAEPKFSEKQEVRMAEVVREPMKLEKQRERKEVVADMLMVADEAPVGRSGTRTMQTARKSTGGQAQHQEIEAGAVTSQAWSVGSVARDQPSSADNFGTKARGRILDGIRLDTNLSYCKEVEVSDMINVHADAGFQIPLNVPPPPPPPQSHLLSCVAATTVSSVGKPPIPPRSYPPPPARCGLSFLQQTHGQTLPPPASAVPPPQQTQPLTQQQQPFGILGNIPMFMQSQSQSVLVQQSILPTAQQPEQQPASGFFAGSPPPPPHLPYHQPLFGSQLAVPPPPPVTKRIPVCGSAPSRSQSSGVVFGDAYFGSAGVYDPVRSNYMTSMGFEAGSFGSGFVTGSNSLMAFSLSNSASASPSPSPGTLLGAELGAVRGKTHGWPVGAALGHRLKPSHFMETLDNAERNLASAQHDRGRGLRALSGLEMKCSSIFEAPTPGDGRDASVEKSRRPICEAVSWRTCEGVAPQSQSYSLSSLGHGPSSTPSLADEEGTAEDRCHSLDSTIRDMIDQEAEELLLDEGTFKFTKKKKSGKLCTLGSQPKIPKKRSTRWESVEAFRERKLAGDMATDLGARESGQIPVVRQGAHLNEWYQQWLVANRDALIGLQDPVKGMWKLDAEFGRVLSIDVDTCKLVLINSGIRSFGLTAASELEDLLATILALLALSLSFCTKAEVMGTITFVKDLIARRTTIEMCTVASELRDFLQTPTFQVASEFCRAVDTRHPLACSSMELASDWLTVGVKLLGF